MRIFVILGPTGTGKTSLSISLAKKMNAEIINADSTQVYKEANIGTAKIKEFEMECIPHHMLNITSLKNNYTVKDYQQNGRLILNNLIKENKNVIIVGGSFLYVKALLYDYKFSEDTGTLSYDNLTNTELKEQVNKIYKENNIHVNNRKRLERFLSHYETTGEIIKNNEGKDTPLYDFTLIGLFAERENLYDHINTRVDQMINDGLIEEATDLYKNGFKKAETLIGYKEIIKYIKGECDLSESINEIKQNTRNYAKRQMTWLKTQFSNINWFQVDYNDFNNTIKKVSDFLDSL